MFILDIDELAELHYAKQDPEYEDDDDNVEDESDCDEYDIQRDLDLLDEE